MRKLLSLTFVVGLAALSAGCSNPCEDKCSEAFSKAKEAMSSLPAAAQTQGAAAADAMLAACKSQCK
jgi:hypothetical protein